MWTRDQYFPACYAHATWGRLALFFHLPGRIISSPHSVAVELRPFNGQQLNQDLLSLCERVNQAAPLLPDGRRLLFAVRNLRRPILHQHKRQVARNPAHLFGLPFQKGGIPYIIPKCRFFSVSHLLVLLERCAAFSFPCETVMTVFYTGLPQTMVAYISPPTTSSARYLMMTSRTSSSKAAAASLPICSRERLLRP